MPNLSQTLKEIELESGGPGSGRHAIYRGKKLAMLQILRENNFYGNGLKDRQQTIVSKDDTSVVRHIRVAELNNKGWLITHHDYITNQTNYKGGPDASSLKAYLSSGKNMSGGGPGSGWTTENGHVGHSSISAHDLTSHLQGLSKNPLPDFVKHAAKSLEAAGLDKRYFESRQMSKFRIADHLAIHPLAIANYNESKRMLEFRKDAGKDDVTHELAHHLDLTFLRSPDKQAGDNAEINKPLAAKVIAAYTSEWQAAKDQMSEDLGHRFRFSNDYEQVQKTPSMYKNSPTLFALDGPKEWFAESLSQYVKGGQYRDRLERIAPETFAAVKTVLTGRIFK
jgi:hypothetical protein